MLQSVTSEEKKHKQIVPYDLPCCPATCPQCLRGMKSKPRPILPTDSHGGELVHPPVIRRKKKPLSMLRKAGELLGAENSSDYVYEKGHLKPVVMIEDQDFWRQDLWSPIPDCPVDSDCPCAKCMCCYTETVVCTVQDVCAATILEQITETRTRTTTKAASVIETVTAEITFTATNTFEFRSTTTTTTRFSSAFSITKLLTQTTSLTSRIYLSTYLEPNLNSTTVFVAADFTVTLIVTADITDLILTQTSIFGGYTLIGPLPTTVTRTSASPVPFTVYGKERTVSTNVNFTKELTSYITLSPAVETITPILPLTTEIITEVLTETTTKSIMDKCPIVETVRVTPTKTKVFTVGTATPSTPCPCQTCP